MALEKMHKEKLGKQEYMRIQKDPTVSQAISDVTSLFDNSVSQMQNNITRILAENSIK